MSLFWIIWAAVTGLAAVGTCVLSAATYRRVRARHGATEGTAMRQ